MIHSIWTRRGTRVWALAAVLLAAGTSSAETVLSQISLPSRHLPHRFYGGMFEFPESIREYSDATLLGYSFRQDLANGGVRELQVSRLHSRGTYLMMTDLFSDGRFSTMSHTVLMIFPRDSSLRSDPYQVSEDSTGEIRIVAPDGSILLVDGATGAVRRTSDFFLDPQGAPRTPPRLHHRGFHLEVKAVGRNPFLRGTMATVTDESGRTCRLTTDELFHYGRKPESDVFRFDTDAELFSYLATRCPSLRTPPARPVQLASAQPPVAGSPPGGIVPILLPAEVAPIPRPASTESTRPWRNGSRGVLPLLWRLFSR